MKIKLQIIFLFLISIILTQDEVTLNKCISNGKCLINGPKASCSENSISTSSSYKEIEKEFTNLAKQYKLSNINQIQCGTKLEQCASIEPGDIDDECTNFDLDNGYSCCYIKLKYKYNTKYGCYPIEKKKSEIKTKIKEMKEYYIGVKKISIYCDESFIKINFYTLILGFLILL